MTESLAEKQLITKDEKDNSRRSRSHCKENVRKHNRTPSHYAEYEAGRIYFYHAGRMEMEKQTSQFYLQGIRKTQYPEIQMR